jgi:hypothetical protein
VLTCEPIRRDAFEPRNARRHLRDVAIGVARHPLPRERLEELVNRQSARIARSTLRRQNVVRSRRLVAECDRRLFAEKERPVAGEPREPPVEIARVHFEMLRCMRVGELRDLFARARDGDLAIVAPRARCRIARRRRQRIDQLRHEFHRTLAERTRRRH